MSETRFYLSRIVQLNDEMGSLGSKTFLYPLSAGGQSIPPDLTTGLPLFDYCFAYATASADDHASMAADPDIYALPAYPQCAKVAAIADDVRAKMWSDLEACGWTVAPLQSIDGYRDLLLEIVAQQGGTIYLPQ